MLELLFEILGEFVLQILGEVLFELGFHALAEPFRKPRDPWLAGLGYLLFGAIAGGLSLLVFPTHLTPEGLWRFLNLIITPIMVGLCMYALGSWRVKRGQRRYRIDQFAYGYVFALSLAIIRFAFAK